MLSAREVESLLSKLCIRTLRTQCSRRRGWTPRRRTGISIDKSGTWLPRRFKRATTISKGLDDPQHVGHDPHQKPPPGGTGRDGWRRSMTLNVPFHLQVADIIWVSAFS